MRKYLICKHFQRNCSLFCGVIVCSIILTACVVLQDLVWHEVTPQMGKPSFQGPECCKPLKKGPGIAAFFKKPAAGGKAPAAGGGKPSAAADSKPAAAAAGEGAAELDGKAASSGAAQQPDSVHAQTEAQVKVEHRDGQSGAAAAAADVKAEPDLKADDRDTARQASEAAAERQPGPAVESKVEDGAAPGDSNVLVCAGGACSRLLEKSACIACAESMQWQTIHDLWHDCGRPVLTALPLNPDESAAEVEREEQQQQGSQPGCQASSPPGSQSGSQPEAAAAAASKAGQKRSAADASPAGKSPGGKRSKKEAVTPGKGQKTMQAFFGAAK